MLTQLVDAAQFCYDLKGAYRARGDVLLITVDTCKNSVIDIKRLY